jgi:hypothetical protein
VRIRRSPSLKIFLEACAADGVEPRKQFSGKFSLSLATPRAILSDGIQTSDYCNVQIS